MKTKILTPQTLVAVLIVFALTVFNQGKLAAQALESGAPTPDVRIRVEKEYDGNGNIIRYDSTYYYVNSSSFSIADSIITEFPDWLIGFPTDHIPDFNEAVHSIMRESTAIMRESLNMMHDLRQQHRLYFDFDAPMPSQNDELQHLFDDLFEQLDSLEQQATRI